MTTPPQDQEHATTDPEGTSMPNRDVEGNGRLTSATGLVLLIMLAIEGFTVLNVEGMITLHIFLGIMLVGPVLLKILTTLYRFGRYYNGDLEYVRRGPPHVVLRVLGPLVVVSSVSLLGTGIALLWQPTRDSFLLTAHQVSFIVWFGVVTIHVLGHLREVFVESAYEIRQLSRRGMLRLGLIAVSLVAGLAIALALFPSASSWTHRSPEMHHHRKH